MGYVRPRLEHRHEGGYDLPVLSWHWPMGLLCVSSGPLGGGIGVRHWVLNATVPMSYARHDPDIHLRELAKTLGLRGTGVGLLTGVDVEGYATGTGDGAVVVATVGLGAPVWAADPAGVPSDADPAGVDSAGAGYRAGTVNLVAHLPVRLYEAALVNAVATMTEAKAQALGELGVAGTGTCTDAVCLSCPLDGPAERYAGPRSTWGSRLALAAHRAVLSGGRDWLADPRSWSARVGAGPSRPAG